MLSSPLENLRSRSWVGNLLGNYYNEDHGDSTFEIANEFLSSTSIHGMKYVGQRYRHMFERICWACFVMLGLFGSAYFCYLEWCKWRNSPLLISQDPTIASHEPLPFPVVTLCSTHKLSDEKIKFILEDSKYSWMNMTFLLKVLRYVVKFDSSVYQEEDVKRIGHALSQHDMDINDLIQIVDKTMLSCSELIIDCQWQSNWLPCDKLFAPILTDNGICCSLNDLSTSLAKLDLNISFQNGPSFLTGAAGAVNEYGVHSALRIVLDAKNSDSSLVVSMFDGFKVLLHNKDDFPDVVKRGFVVGAGFDHYVALNAMSIYYTSNIPAIPFERRECYVEGEGQLKYHSKYTRSGCLYECRIDLVLEKCGCLPYYIDIKVPSNQSIPKCSLEAYPCAAAIYAKGQSTLEGGVKNCRCPGTCKDQWFTTEISAVPFSAAGMSNSRLYRRIPKRKNVTAASFVKNLVGMRIYFRYNSGDSYRMDVPYGVKELIASMGGLLGLGLGFSVISAVELIYFLCIRCCFRKNRSFTVERRLRQSKVNPNLFAGRHPLENNSFRNKYYFGISMMKTAPETGKTATWINALAPGELLKKQ